MQVTASIFNAYDIRGVVGQTLDEAVAEHLGRAFGTEARQAGERAVAIGRDGRLSGPGLVAALIRGLRSTGIDVIDLGAVTTPMLYYVAATRGEQGCHFPPAHQAGADDDSRQISGVQHDWVEIHTNLRLLIFDLRLQGA